jgi:hypothetical protein
VNGQAYFDWKNFIGRAGGVIELQYSNTLRIMTSFLDFACGGGHLLASLLGKQRLRVEINPSARGDAYKYGFACLSRGIRRKTQMWPFQSRKS